MATETDTARKQAQTLLDSEIGLPAFFQKLAELNIPCRSQQDAETLLDIATMLDQEPAEKVATAGVSSFFTEARNSLARHLGIPDSPPPQLVKAAEAAAGDPRLAAAVMQLLSHG